MNNNEQLKTDKRANNGHRPKLKMPKTANKLAVQCTCLSYNDPVDDYNHTLDKPYKECLYQLA